MAATAPAGGILQRPRLPKHAPDAGHSCGIDREPGLCSIAAQTMTIHALGSRIARSVQCPSGGTRGFCGERWPPPVSTFTDLLHAFKEFSTDDRLVKARVVLAGILHLADVKAVRQHEIHRVLAEEAQSAVAAPVGPVTSLIQDLSDVAVQMHTSRVCLEGQPDTLRFLLIGILSWPKSPSVSCG